MDSEPRAGTVDVGGAKLYYETRGSGPVLLVTDSGGGEVDRFEGFAGALADTFTVVTYDRRGFARSPIDGPAEPVSFARHADDAAALLAELTPAPAVVLGLGLGVATALGLAVYHPSQVALVIGHEPLLPELIEPDLRAPYQQELTDLENTYRTQGLGGAVVQISRLLGALRTQQRKVEDSLAADRGAAAAAPPPGGASGRPTAGQRTANFDFILTNEIPAGRALPFDLDAVRQSDVEIIAGVGAASDATLLGPASARGLAERLHVELSTFPGGHNPHITDSIEFADRVRALVTRTS